MQSGSTYTSAEDTSTSGTIVLRGQRDDPESPQTPKSKLGMPERCSSSSFEDGAINLAEVGIIYSLRLMHYFQF